MSTEIDKMAEVGPAETDPVEDAAFHSWLEMVKGSWSQSDWKIYLAGYREGWMGRGRAIAKAVDGGGNDRNR